MATTRLRQTFRYPTDDDEAEAEEGMDEQDQETLISTLSTRDTSSTILYTRLLLSLPLLPVVLYIPRLFTLNTFIPSLTAIASLLASAFTLYYMPLPPVRADASPGSKEKGSGKTKGKGISRDSHGLRTSVSRPDDTVLPYLSVERSEVVRRYLVPVNGVICTLLAIHELSQGREWRQGMMIGGGYVPGFIMCVILWARKELRVVDLGELERLRYRSQAL